MASAAGPAQESVKKPEIEVDMPEVSKPSEPSEGTSHNAEPIAEKKTGNNESVVDDLENLVAKPIQKVQDCDIPSVKCMSPPVAKVAAENRQFQKTRSFSAVEDNPEKKTVKVPPGKSGDFCFKDVALSRSEQLDRPKVRANDEDQQSRKGRNENRDAAPNPTLERDLRKSPKQDLMMNQLSYFTETQPMSLQNDSTYCEDFDMIRKNSRDIRKSGRDLSNFSANETNDLADRPKSSRIASGRARLESNDIIAAITFPYINMPAFLFHLSLLIIHSSACLRFWFDFIANHIIFLYL